MDTQLLIGSTFVAGTEAEEHILNPKTGATIIDLAEASHIQIDAAVDAAERAFAMWSLTTPAERSGYLLRIADAIEKHADDFAALEALNCGKPINAVPCMRPSPANICPDIPQWSAAMPSALSDRLRHGITR